MNPDQVALARTIDQAATRAALRAAGRAGPGFHIGSYQRGYGDATAVLLGAIGELIDADMLAALRTALRKSAGAPR